ncbi:hypothetical protein [Paenibacillus lupini]|uniref:hypothetical protein n=1 Tax=Paenibacillus lupini TaxID=1450204 RepID=UPI0014243A53|nr:hypothetical protein [Paenibacillus lupini]NIK26905.1 hypothetical protein [Paenibacillus lupini]
MNAFNNKVVVQFLLAVSVVVIIVGYIQLNNSVLWGTEKVSEYMIEKMQGSMDTGQYNIMLQGFIEQIKWSGSILLGLGGILFITCMTLVLNKRSGLNSLEVIQFPHSDS